MGSVGGPRLHRILPLVLLAASCAHHHPEVAVRRGPDVPYVLIVPGGAARRGPGPPDVLVFDRACRVDADCAVVVDPGPWGACPALVALTAGDAALFTEQVRAFLDRGGSYGAGDLALRRCAPVDEAAVEAGCDAGRCAVRPR
jgi:hypothetical protein